MERWVTFLLHRGHLWVDCTAVRMQFLQNMWPQRVEEGSRLRTLSKQTGHLYDSSHGSVFSTCLCFGGETPTPLTSSTTTGWSLDVFNNRRRLTQDCGSLESARLMYVGSWRLGSGEHRSMIASGARLLADRGIGLNSMFDRSIKSTGWSVIRWN